MALSGSGEEIAIIGTSCRVAGADSPSELWQSMMTGEDLQSDTGARFSGYYDEVNGKTKGLTNVHHAYLLKHGIDRFDNSFFGIAPVEAAAIDPQQRLLLEICWEAFESAGLPLDKLKGSETAVFAGLFTSDYGTSLLRDIDSTPKYHSTGTSNSIAANRISYFFDLRGPSMVIDTACSSTVTALHQAIATLKAGEAEQAVVCGANLILNPDMFVTMSELGFLSPRGRCHSFDASGDGYARGEGVMAIVLKPLRQAIADNDPIRAVIRGSRLNQDGRTNGITLPSGEAQEENIRKLYANIGILPSDLDYLEAHGTGTKVGDPIEMGAIERVFASEQRSQKLVVGSVKSHVGHLEACAALVGIIKTIECLERGFIPAQLHLQNPNPKINFNELYIPTSVMPWPERKGRARMAGINSFGFGGANGHVVLEQYLRTEPDITSEATHFLIKVSAETESALIRSREKLAGYLSASAVHISDVSYTSLLRRSLLRKSQYFVASSTADLAQQLLAEAKTLPPIITSGGGEGTKRLAFVLTGQGAQWPQMGKELLDICPIFTSVIDECDHILSRLPDPPSWKLRDELCLLPSKSNVNSSRYSQPLCTALQLGLITFWHSLGIHAVACVGHSSGEISGAYAAGILTLKDSITVAYYRGIFMSAASTTKPGAMAAISMSAEECIRMLSGYDGKVDLAAVNSPSSCTISGDASCIDAIVERFKAEGIFCRKLRVDTAFHSHHMLPLAGPYRAALEKAGVSPVLTAKSGTSTTMYSSVYGRSVCAAEVTPEYWAKNMTQTVRFCDAIASLAKLEDVDAYLEVGPHPALKGPAIDSITNAVGQDRIPDYFSTLTRGLHDSKALFASVGAMISARMPLDLETAGIRALGLSHASNRVLFDYPCYNWDHSSVHWAESRVSRAHRFRKHCRDMILGSRIPHDTPLSMCWRNILRADEFKWLDERVTMGEPMLSPSLLLQMAIKAGSQLANDHNATSLRLTDIHFHEPPSKTEMCSSRELETQFQLIPRTSDNYYTFRLLIHNTTIGDSWYTAVEGKMWTSSECLPSLEPGPKSAAAGRDESTTPCMESGLPECPEKVAFFENDRDSISGEVKGPIGFSSTEKSDLELFDWIFSLLYRQMSVLAGPSSYTLTTIDEFTIDLNSVQASPVQFQMNIQDCVAGRGQAKLIMTSSGAPSLVVTGATSIVTEQEQKRPPVSSLFFKPTWLPDLAAMKASDTGSLSLRQLIELVTHKWSSCDIGIATKSSKVQALVLSLLPGARSSERPRFRSVSTGLVPTGLMSERVFHDEGCSPKDLRLLFVDEEQLGEKNHQVMSEGYICVLCTRSNPVIEAESDLERLCAVELDSSTSGILLRRKSTSNTTSENLQTLKIFTASTEASLENLQSLHSASEKHKPGEPVDLVIFDNGKQSLLCMEPPEEWLTSVQKLVADARKLLWITTDADDLPHWGAVSGFLRTLSSEQPLLSVASLNVSGDVTQQALKAIVESILGTMRRGSKESELRFEDGQLKILRYLPDDELNALTGAGPVHRAFSRVTSINHGIGHAQFGQMILNPIRHLNAAPSAAEGLVDVEVYLSVMDIVDVEDAFSPKASLSRPGQFFLGSAVQGNNLYIGYQPGCHVRRLRLPAEQVLEIPRSGDPRKTLLSLASHAIAYAIMTQVARARPDDVFRISFNNNNTSAFENVVRFLGCHLVDSERQAADFNLEFLPETGFALNGKIIDVKSALRKTRFNSSLARAWISIPDRQTALPEYNLSQVQVALTHAAQRGDVVIVKHDNGLEALQEFRHTGASCIFRKDVFYVLVGGFGGLGLLLMQWMLNNGARNFAVISRSGAASKGAQNATQKIDALGGKLLAIKADAGDAQAMQSTMSMLRSILPIGGCFNMALILDNSPFSTMTPTQWNLGIRHKVDTAVSLHQATLQDQLDFFIMFSSISSISGNRTQAAYASGNAFQNAMAEYRRTIGLPAVSIALGAMEGVGTLAEDTDTLRTLEQSGLRLLNASEFLQIVEAAVHESRHQDRHLLVTGFQVFSAAKNAGKADITQGQVFWEGFPEFSHLFEHEPRAGEDPNATVPLAQRLTTVDESTAQHLLCSTFLDFLAGLLGYPVSKLDSTQAIAAYGVDSLNAVACRFWFFQQLNLDVPIFDVLGSRSIDAMISKSLARVREVDQAKALTTLPHPKDQRPDKLTARTLSHSQSRLWFLHNFLKDKTLYNLLLTCHVNGTINTTVFQKSWQALVMRHDALRTCIVASGSSWLQVPAKYSTFSMVEVHCSAAEFPREDEKLTSKARKHLFDPSKGALISGWLLVSPIGTRFYMASHHLAWDRGSVATIFEELPQIYKNLINEKEPYESLESDPIQFIDYTLWQNKILETKELVRPHEDYWRTQLQGIPDCVSLLRLSRVAERPVVKQQEASSANAFLSPAEAKRLKAFCASHAVTPFMFTTFVMGSLVHGLTGDDDIVIGIADGDRGHTAFDRMVGFTVNMLPLRMRYPSDRTCSALLEDLRNVCLQAYEHRVVPFDYLLQVLDVPRKTSHNPIFQIVVNYQSQGAFPKPDFGDFQFVDYDHYNARTQTDVSLEVEESTDGSMEFHFDFDASMYGTDVAEKFAQMYVFQLEQVIEDANKSLNQLQLASPQDVQMISQLLQPELPDGKSIEGMRENLFTDLFEHWATMNPSKEALVDGKTTISYKDLDELSRCLAVALLSTDISPQECIGVCCEPGVEMMVAVYGILRARCIVVPIDPDVPLDRIISIVEDTDLSTIIVVEPSKTVKQKLISAGVIDIREVKNLTKPARSDRKMLSLKPTQTGDVFCALFTSGSTGRPKGVYIGHEQLRYQGEQYHETLGTNPNDRMLLSSALIFDMSLHSIFGTILHGSTLIIATREERYSAEKMNELVVRQKITNCIFTPTQLKLMLRASNQALLKQWKLLRSLTLGGEPVPSWVLTEFLLLNLPHASLFNGYAPTETTIINSLRRCTSQDAEGDFLPLSTPLAPAQFYILDNQGRQTAIGVPGELFIGGRTVNNGYIKRSELSESSFIPNILSTYKHQDGKSRVDGLLYRTGDTFCLEANGNLRALGRIAGNRQVKIRGMRVELDEIESVLYSALSQLDTASGFETGLTGVVYYPRDDLHGWLIAYVECAEEEDSIQAEVGKFLKAKLKASLAVHMVPNDIRFVTNLPKTTTGKLDYKTLLSWDISIVDDRPSSGQQELQSEEERSLARIWNEVLGTDREMWRDTDFFSAGGSSILLLRVRTSIYAMHGIDISLADMFAYPDIQGMAALLEPQVEQSSPNSWTLLDESDLEDSVKHTQDTQVATSEPDSNNILRQPRSHAKMIDWETEIALPAEWDWTQSFGSKPTCQSTIALTGATSMIGAHLLAHLLRESDAEIHCLAVSGSTKDEGKAHVKSALATWKLDTGLTSQHFSRIIVYNGDLAHPTLGLQESEIRALDVELSEIWHLESDVSLLKSYDSLRRSNIGSLRFLIELAGGTSGNMKALHYLSTWAVPHLQAWNATTRSPDFISTEPVSMSHMRPGRTQNLGYLKIRWVAEQLLAAAAKKGIACSVFRSCMCAPAQPLGCALPRTDINRRILAGSLHTGLVPDFGSSVGGGMSWIDASFLVQAMCVLARQARGAQPKPAIHHLTAAQHRTYADLADLLGPHVRLASPGEWFTAMRADGNAEMILQADVLEEWWEAGWRPFAIDGSASLAKVQDALELSPPDIDGTFLRQVVGNQPF